MSLFRSRWLHNSKHTFRHRSLLRLERVEDRIAPAVTEFFDPNPAAGNVFGHAVATLSNGNVVITAPGDDAGGSNAGAVYLFNGANGALISTLRGAQAGDSIGGRVYALTNGNFVVASWQWDNGAIADAGAVTWGNGNTGISGVVSAANSLVGSTANDNIGFTGVVALTNGNYVVPSPTWDNGAFTNAGAATWCNGATGATTGVIAAANSLVGSKGNDSVGDYVLPLTNGNYVACARAWDNGAVQDAGAVTWGNGTVGISGVVSAANSLVGNKLFDFVGGLSSINSSASCVTALANGNYVVRSSIWDNGSTIDVGAVTWANGTTGVMGVITSANSLVGTSFDSIGTTMTELTNGNFVVGSPYWNNGAVADAGALTWVNGATGITGAISAANSLVGSKSNDRVGYATALTNGNYVVSSPDWDSPTISNAGAATWANGATGLTGTITTANSLIGAKSGDAVGRVYALANGNYIVISISWDSASFFDVGAVTWGNGTSGTTGVVSAANSLVGSTQLDMIGSQDPTILTNGNYVLYSPTWDNGAIGNAGAATWGNGTTGITGVVSAANSLVGTVVNASNGTTVVALKNGNYLVRAPYWHDGVNSGVGAVTWGSGTIGISGTISSANSLVGTKASDQVGLENIATFANGHYAVVSRYVDNGAITDAGALTWGNGNTGITGAVTTANSVMGSVASTSLQDTAVIDNVNGTFYGRFTFDGGGRVRGGYQATGFTVPPPTVTGVTFGDGTNQRSMVKQIVVTFSESVTFSGTVASAFTLSRTGGGTPTGPVTLSANPISGPASAVTITYSGSMTENGSLRDGFYDFTISAAQVSSANGALDGNNDGIAGGSYFVNGNTANKYFRLFGDGNGSGVTDLTDFAAFRSAFNLGPNTVFDYGEGDNNVGLTDFARFRSNFNLTP